MALLTVCVLLLLPMIAALGKSVRELEHITGTIIFALAFLAHAFLMVALFLTMPPSYLLRRLQISSFWAYAAAGAFSGCLFLFVSFVDASVATKVMSTRSPIGVFLAYWDVYASSSATLGAHFVAAVGVKSLMLFALLGAAISAFAWRTPLYRLSHDNNRDWEGRILGARPPYAD